MAENHFILLRDPVGQEFGQGTAGMASLFHCAWTLAGKIPVAEG